MFHRSLAVTSCHVTLLCHRSITTVLPLRHRNERLQLTAASTNLDINQLV